MLSLHDPIERLHLVGPKNAESLHHLGLNSVADLLFYFPRDWQDLTEIKTISQISPNEKVNLKALVKKITQRRSRWRRMHLTEALLADDTGNIVAVWFNQPFLKNSLLAGKEYYFSGKAQIHETLQLTSPAFEPVKNETIHTAGIIPQYDLSSGVSQKQLRYFLKQCLQTLPQLPDLLPGEIRRSLSLPELQRAIQNIHFPENLESLDLARKRLAFDELFLFQLAFQSYKRKLKALPAPPIPFNKTLIKKIVGDLPFKLTPSQRLAVWEILQDLEKPYPMNRLLEGEVGSGKTVVAGIAMLEVGSRGFQSVLLAPTEILAWQHFQTLQELLKNSNLEIALLTRSNKLSSQYSPSNLELPIVVGTHALLQEKVQFKNIGLLVVDEQHRFGVKQRAYLQNSKNSLVPHLLSMTATPIPRTLALAMYGDLDISVLKELPSGRKKVITKLVDVENRQKAYDFIRKLLQKGQQVYVVTPLIEESDKLETKAARSEVAKLQSIFPEFSIGLLHGRLPGQEKKQIMADFQSRQIQILVSTTVIEVGLDIPNATVMIIENAERFGLSQLHQLRGRVGRSNLQSFCLLFAEQSSELTSSRLAAVVESTDGFALAEKDLELRGPGEVMGKRQSGYIPFKIAKLSDRKLITLAKTKAEALLDKSPLLAEFPLLKNKIEELARNAHLE